jgi:hypothetical protein
MNHAGKETAENFYGTGERDHQLMLRCDGVSGYVRLPEDIARRSRRGMATGGNIGGEIHPSKKLFAEKGKELFAWRSRWDSNPRASKG